jgi:hypothetical protein
MSFYKHNSYAKHINDLSFVIKTSNNSVYIKNKKIKKNIQGKCDNHSQNPVINEYYQELNLIVNAIAKIFEDVDSNFHKYINIKFQCQNIYVNNLLSEWISKWATNDFINVPNCSDISNIFSYINKCKIVVE